MLKKVALAAALGAALVSNAALAGQATTTIAVSATITGGCTVAATAMAFGSIVLTSVNTDASSTLTVNCTSTVPYTIGINDGGNAGLGTHNRQMFGGVGNNLPYQVYKDAARTLVFDSLATDPNVDNGVGTGANQSFTVFGRVPVQPTPAAVAYSDSLTVTVFY